MRATEELMHEHEGITLMLAIMEAVAGTLAAGGAVPKKDLEGIVEFLSVFADTCHHGKEEAHLFPALERAGVPREGGPIGVLLEEHARGRRIIARLQAGVGGYRPGDPGAAAKVRVPAGEYVALLRRHIDKENTVLFPMAEGRISAAEDDRLVEAYEVLERERIGEGRHEAFHKLLKSLKVAYAV